MAKVSFLPLSSFPAELWNMATLKLFSKMVMGLLFMGKQSFFFSSFLEMLKAF